jgi:predicted aspartyl protease
MPRLKKDDPRLRRDGPTLKVQVEPVLDAQRVMLADGDEVPSVSVSALIDTGASGTLIQTAVIDKLGLD